MGVILVSPFPKLRHIPVKRDIALLVDSRVNGAEGREMVVTDLAKLFGLSWKTFSSVASFDT